MKRQTSKPLTANHTSKLLFQELPDETLEQISSGDGTCAACTVNLDLEAENNEQYFELTLEMASLISGGEGNATGYSFNYSSNHTTGYQGHYTQIAWADAQ